MYRTVAHAQDLAISRRAAQLADVYFDISGHNGFVPEIHQGLVNLPASRFLRPYDASRRRLEPLRMRHPFLADGREPESVYVDAAADPEKAIEIVATGKTSAPATCNATECVLVHRDAAPWFAPRLAERAKFGTKTWRFHRARNRMLIALVIAIVLSLSATGNS